MNKVSKPKLNVSIAIASLTFVMLSFQNCSKGQYASTDLEAMNLNKGAILNTGDLPDGNFVVGDGGFVSIDPVSNEEITAEPASAGPVIAEPNSTEQASTEPKSTEQVSTEPNNQPENNCEKEIVVLRKLCEKNPNGNVSNGVIIIVPTNMDTITENSDGRLILCGVNLKKVTKLHGRLDLVDSTVDEIISANGNVHQYGNSNSNMSAGASLQKCKGRE